jgi:hypothetical protein
MSKFTKHDLHQHLFQKKKCFFQIILESEVYPLSKYVFRGIVNSRLGGGEQMFENAV